VSEAVKMMSRIIGEAIQKPFSAEDLLGPTRGLIDQTVQRRSRTGALQA
jgi:hypothetical protein